jgi:hypothetical protein
MERNQLQAVSAECSILPAWLCRTESRLLVTRTRTPSGPGAASLRFQVLDVTPLTSYH